MLRARRAEKAKKMGMRRSRAYSLAGLLKEPFLLSFAVNGLCLGGRETRESERWTKADTTQDVRVRENQLAVRVERNESGMRLIRPNHLE